MNVNTQPSGCARVFQVSSVFLLSVLSVPLWLLPLHAQQSYPMLMSISPVAVQIGTTTECEIEARYSLHGTYKIVVSGEGVTGEVDSPVAQKVDDKPGRKRPNVSRLKVRFKVAAGRSEEHTSELQS